MSLIFKAILIAALLAIALVFRLQGVFLLLILGLTVMIIWLPTKPRRK